MFELYHYNLVYIHVVCNLYESKLLDEEKMKCQLLLVKIYSKYNLSVYVNIILSKIS